MGNKKKTRTLEAVFFPERFSPFAIVPGMNIADFKHLWQTNRHWILANMAHAAYHSVKTVIALMNRLGARACYYYDRNGAQAYLSVWPQKAILAFRGTQCKSGNDIAADLLFFPVPYGRAKVQYGFLRELDKLWPLIEKDLPKQSPSPSATIPVWATGHSLGGAMAALAGMRFEFQEVVTFGEPPIGQNIDTMFMSKQHTRYVNDADPVSNLPETINKHHGKQVRITSPAGLSDWRYDHAVIYYAENLFSKPQCCKSLRASEPRRQG